MTKTLTAERLHTHPDRDDVLVQPINGEGNDYIRICVTHEYASPPVVYIEDAGACPFCLAEAEAIQSRVRYRELMGQLS